MENSLNCFNIAGTVQTHGIKAGKFPKLWLKVGLEPIFLNSKNTSLDNVSVFVNIDLDPNETSKKGLLGKHIVEQLKSMKFVFLSDISFTNISRSKKDANGEWTSIDEPGYKTSIRNIVLSDTRIESLNLGLLSGKVQTQSDKKILLRQDYKIPGKDIVTYKSRELPVYLDTDLDVGDILGKKIFIVGKVCFSSEKETSYIISGKYITHD